MNKIDRVIMYFCLVAMIGVLFGMHKIQQEFISNYSKIDKLALEPALPDRQADNRAINRFLESNRK